MKDTVQPEVQVRIPKINLRLEDLLYLRALTGPQKIKCELPASRKDRLRFLGLIEDAEIPQPPSVIAEADKEIKAIKARIQTFLDTDDASALGRHDITYTLDNARRRKEPTKGFVITKLGLALLDKGEVTVKVKKTGCL